MIRIAHPTGILNGTIELPSSKSISNRLLILRKLYDADLQISDISEARDSQLLLELLDKDQEEMNVKDAGTAMRFLAAYSACRDRRTALYGEHRMHQRPISELVEALRSLGANIHYLESEGYPPLSIYGGDLRATVIDMRSARSSQFISALLMILPKVEGNPVIRVDPGMPSWPFVELTLRLMELIGFRWIQDESSIRLLGRDRKAQKQLVVEKDWTSFYYWFAAAALAQEADLFFPGLHLDGFQTESVYCNQLNHPLLQVVQEEEGLRLLRKPGQLEWGNLVLDLADHTDLAPTFALLMGAVQSSTVRFQGLEFLTYKESDRDAGIADHLKQLHVNWERLEHSWLLDPSQVRIPKEAKFNSRDDHRLAMSVLPLALSTQVQLVDEEVVAKSYPGFWEQAAALGFEIK